MEPTYQDGDLVLVRQHSSYHQGEVIAFHAGGTFNDPTRVIHRIVGDAPDGGFNTQGDNRDRIDPWTPTNENIIGSAFFHVPKAGDAAGLITKPETFAALGGAAVVVGGQRRRRKRRPSLPPSDRESELLVSHASSTPPAPANRAATPGAQSPRWVRLAHPRWALIGLVTCAVLAVPVLGSTWSALRAPDSTQTTESLGSIDYGIGLDYRFSGTKSAVYPTGTVEANRTIAGALEPTDPLYTRLLDRLDITVGFRATGQGADSLSSAYDVDVVVSTPDGWSTTLQTIGTTTFERSGREAIAVDLRAVAQQVESVAALTGVGGDAYTITVTPTLDVAGAAADNRVDETLTAPMAFDVKGSLITANAVEIIWFEGPDPHRRRAGHVRRRPVRDAYPAGPRPAQRIGSGPRGRYRLVRLRPLRRAWASASPSGSPLATAHR